MTPWTATRLASLSFTISQSLLKLTSIESNMPSNHLIFCHPLLSSSQSFAASGSFTMSLSPHLFFPQTYLFLIEGKLLHNIVLTCAIHHRESAIAIHVSPPSWTESVLALSSEPSTLLELNKFLKLCWAEKTKREETKGRTEGSMEEKKEEKIVKEQKRRRGEGRNGEKWEQERSEKEWRHVSFVENLWV